MMIRNAVEADYNNVIAIVNDWCGGNRASEVLPRLLFKHFSDTCFILEENGKMVGYLAGYISQTHPEQACIHFFGIDPSCRGKSYGRLAYRYFFHTVKQQGCSSVQCVVPVENKQSIMFHQALGFETREGDTIIDGIHCHRNYDGAGCDMAVFIKRI